MSTISKHIRDHRKNNKFTIKSRGRPRKTDWKTNRAILISAKLNRFRTNSELGQQFSVSKDTIRRRLDFFNYQSHKAIRDVLTHTQKLLRVRWCRVNTTTNFNFWIFSDESSFELADLSAPNRLSVHRSSEEKYAPCCLLPKPTKNRQKLMIWGAISCDGPVGFCIFEENVKWNVYIDTLRNILIPFLDSLPLIQFKSIQFQDDNARPHRAHQVTEFLASNGIRRPFWPPYSPDLNPIEKIWAEMKRIIRLSGPRSINQLRIAINEAWNSVVTQEYCQKLYSSLPACLEQVISKKGVR